MVDVVVRPRFSARAVLPDPSRQPPSEATLAALRRGLERVLDMPVGTFELKHECSSWRTELVARILFLSGDPDAAIWAWLKDGAAGIAL